MPVYLVNLLPCLDCSRIAERKTPAYQVSSDANGGLWQVTQTRNFATAAAVDGRPRVEQR